MPRMSVVCGPVNGLAKAKSGFPPESLLLTPGDMDVETTKGLMSAVVRALSSGQDCVILTNNPVWVELAFAIQTVQRRNAEVKLLQTVKLPKVSIRHWEKVKAGVSVSLYKVDDQGNVVRLVDDLNRSLHRDRWLGLLTLCERLNSVVAQAYTPKNAIERCYQQT